MNQPLVTVVVPVFKVEKYLNKCIESIVTQTYRNLEIILVDDESPDSCPQICDEWKDKDSRINVIHKKNQGLGMARNTGIENSTGEYIYFCDSDDYIDPTLIEKCVNKLIENKSDVVVFGITSVTENEEIIKHHIPNASKTYFSSNEVKEIFIPHYLCGDKYKGENWNLSISACICVFSMEIIKKSKFRFVSERDIISEDTYSLLKFYSSVNSVSVINESFYFYRSNSQSLTHVYREDRFEKNNRFYLSMVELCEELGYDDEIKRLVAYPYFNNVLGAINNIFLSSLEKKERKNILKTIVSNEVFMGAIKNIKYKERKIKNKILIFLLKKKCINSIYFLFIIK